MVLTLLALAAVCLLLAAHPFTTFPMTLRWLVARSRATVGAGAPAARAAAAHAPGPGTTPAAADAPSFAILMCAYNEAKVIDAKMRNLLALREREPGLEILVYVDAASDDTAAILGRYADRITLHVSESRHGKTYGMNLLVARAKASILVFTDANIMLDSDVLQNLRRHFADSAVGCVCGTIHMTNPQESATAASGSFYMRLDERIRALEHQTGSVMGAHGGLFAIRRALHHRPPDHIIDDMYVSFNVLCDGYKVIQPDDVKAYEEAASVMREEFRRKVRIACQAYNVHRLVWPRVRQLRPLFVYEYLSHKWLRWLSFYFLVASGVFGLAALVAAGQPWLAAAALACVAVVLMLGRHPRFGLFARVLDLLSALAGTALGVWRSARGDLYQTWTPAASVRKG